jgi:hypothetical protein
LKQFGAQPFSAPDLCYAPLHTSQVRNTLSIEKMIKIISIIAVLICLNTISFANDLVINKNITYPFKASEERVKVIESEYKRITPGVSATEVIKLLGKPDETHPLFEPKIKNPNQIGFTHWYLIQRLKEVGSMNEKQEKLVRISYDLNWNVTAVDHWGFK